MENKNNEQKRCDTFRTDFFHGTKADLKVDGLIEAGYNSNYGQQKNKIYLLDSNIRRCSLGSRTCLWRRTGKNILSRTNRRN